MHHATCTLRRKGFEISRLFCTAAAMTALCLASERTLADWTPDAAGTYSYLDTANWAGGVIDDTFPASLTLLGAQTATFNADRATTGSMNFLYGGAFGVTLRADGGGARTLTLGGDINVAPVANQAITIGSATANQNLHVDLGGSTRTLTVNTGKTLNLLNTVSNGGLAITGGGTVNLQGGNTLEGGIEVQAGTLTAAAEASLGPVSNPVLINGGILVLGGTPYSALRGFEIGAAGGTLRVVNNTAHVLGRIDATGLATFTGSNIADLTLAGDNRFVGGINCGAITMLRVASHENLGGPATAFTGGVKLSLVGDFMTGFDEHPLSSVTTVFLELQSPTCVFTITNQLSGSINSLDGAPFQKYGPGTVVIAAPQTYGNVQARYGTAVLGGTLVLDAGLGGTLRSTTGGSIALGNGAFLYRGAPTGTTSQSVTGVYLDALHNNHEFRKTGSAVLTVDSNGGAGTTFNMGILQVLNSNSHGTAIDFRLVGENAAVTTTTGNDASGMLGTGRATFHGKDWAVAGEGGVIGAYAGYTVGLPASGAGTALNYRHTGNASVTASQTVNTLKLDSSVSGQSLAVDAGQTLTLATGGLLFAGDHDYTVSGGSISNATQPVPDLILHQQGEGTLSITSVIANGAVDSHLTKTGPGTVVLGALTNSYTGFTYVNEGTLSISANSQLGLPSSNKRVILQGGTLRATETFSLDNNGGTPRRSIGVGGNGGTIDVAAGKTLSVLASIFGQPIGGTTNGRGLGRLILNNSDDGDGIFAINSQGYFTGGVVIEAGILRMGNAEALNPTGMNTLTFGSGSTMALRLNGFNPMLAGLFGAAENAVVENTHASNTSTLTIANGGQASFAGVLRNGAGGALALVKTGRGTQVLSGASTYTGSTTVLSGTLQVDGSLAAASAVTVSGGALGGSGTVAGPVTVAAGGALAPGGSVGTLTTGALTLSAGTVLNYELGTVGNSDRVDVAGDLTLDGLLNVSALGGFGAGQYTLLTYTGTLTDNGLELGDVPDAGLVYSVKTSTPGSVILSAAAPGTVLLIR